MSEVIGNTVVTPNPYPDWSNITNKPTLGALAAKDEVAKSDLSEEVQAALENADSALQSYTETDPTVPDWAKAETKPSYTADEVGALPITGGTLTGILRTSASTPLIIGNEGKIGMRAAPTDAVTGVNHVGQINISNAWWNTGEGEVQNQWGTQISGYNGKTGKYNELRVSHEGVQYNSEDGSVYQILHSGNKGVANGVAELDENGKVLSAQLPSLATVATSGNYNDLTGRPTKVSDFENDLGYITQADAPGSAEAVQSNLTEHINNKNNPHGVSLTQLGITATATELNYVDGVTSNIQTQLNKKADDYSIELYNGTSGNPKPVKFATVDYSTCGSENGVSIKIGMVSGHGNGTSYAFLQDAIIKVNHTGAVQVDNFKYYGQETSYNGTARQYGDIFWVIDTTNKIVDFYCLMGQYARVNMTPWKRLTYSSGGTITQYTTAAVYSSGTIEWANNSNLNITTVLNRTTNVNQADENYTALMARGVKLLDKTAADAITDWKTQLVNGAIAWIYE
jgi:hypothetical protein